MGVRGLSSFFNLNPDLSEWKNLHDTKLVIDGNNLIYMLYYSSHLECVYGGDYDRYAAAIRNYFGIFKTCNVEVILVFDGGYDVSDRKLKTCQRRLQDRLTTAKAIARTGAANQKILPILAHDVFKDVVRELGIPVMQCSSEADEEITAIANHFGCPVASQDSDFYIFDIAGGFIRLDSIANVPSTTAVGDAKVSALSCRWYHIDHLLAHFPGFDRCLLPLFATLLGNDFVNGSTFENFLGRIKLPKLSKRKLKISKRHTNMIGLLHWLQTATSVEGTISQVLVTLKSGVRDEAEKSIRDAVIRYGARSSSFVRNLQDGSQLELLNSSGAPFPRWFAEQFFSGVLSPYLLNVAIVHKVFHLTQIDCFEMPSSYACSLPLRKTLYGLVLAAEEGSDVAIEEFDREGKNMVRRLERPSYEISRFGRLPKLHEIEELDVSTRRRLFDCVFEFDACTLKYPEPLHIMLAVVSYWLQHACSSTNENLLRSLLLNTVLLRLLPRATQSSKKVCGKPRSTSDDPNPINIEEVLLGVQDEQMTQVVIDETCKHFSKFWSRPTHNHARHFDADLVYSCCQLQTCLMFARSINRVLLRPYSDAQFHRSFNGTFLYNFTKELDTRPKPDLFIAEYLGRGSPLEVAFSRFYKEFRSILPDCCFERRAVPSRKKKKNRNVRDKHTDEEESEESVVLLTNRFADL
ncbi:hypothetical protein HPB47_002510 [Ixodes persulcatus]|uniref:Uncharacterized protein n=1 Tax=Ixodes persulcatus TaxID=34615 RepID=A0AC60PL35_IXOPE|nr:hypothetical protein HPB47_002510 [Ixodes persulcatus]